MTDHLPGLPLASTDFNLPPAFWIAVVALSLLIVLSSLLRPRPDPFPYEAADALFTDSEREFLHILDEAVGDEFRILGKVRLADIIQVREGTEGSQWQAAFNRIRAKHLDYVGCDPETLEIVWVLELDDISHNRPERIERDEFVEGALARAEIPLVRIPVAEEYDPEELRGEILDAV